MTLETTESEASFQQFCSAIHAGPSPICHLLSHSLLPFPGSYAQNSQREPFLSLLGLLPCTPGPLESRKGRDNQLASKKIHVNGGY